MKYLCDNVISIAISGILIFSIVDVSKVHSAESLTENNNSSALDYRIEIERKTRYQPFVLTPHKPNYILPITYNSKPNNSHKSALNNRDLDKKEIKFQLSIKFPIAENLISKRDSLHFAYTHLSFWQAYDQDGSSPFRETVHEPEVFMSFENDWEFLGLDNRIVQFGIVHQSNGRDGELSRSWNRVYMDFIFEMGNYYLSFKPWYFHEDWGTSRQDNPDIDTYLGHFELRGVHASDKHTVSLMLRNNLEHPNYGAIEMNWSFPMSQRAKWFIQYFNGYGESLIDYNASVNRIGIGIAFTDWL
jgi:phospholipase A1